MALTFKERFNRKYGFPKDKSHSLKEIAKLTGYKLSNIQKIFQKGKGAFFSAGPSRPNIEPFGMLILKLIKASILFFFLL